ncbi:hypothetical protein H6G72_03975 [Planktothricoides sp. FACHB-1370]|uniref:Uncharacterized protein n=1 Tax=Planktothricoides raciborskii FACHB-1370 TaxID=2949576 RepID=A0ABR8E8I3_9CYAN|nr:hypothetical protein [Planktothricoides raciborskii FACHB-1370]MBD2581902.1 hypothetical protein [Planktothricoides raciborskii FACHB-1261]
MIILLYGLFTFPRTPAPHTLHPTPYTDGSPTPYTLHPTPMAASHPVP